MRKAVLLFLALTALGGAVVPGPGRAGANPLSSIASAAAGEWHTCALTVAGGVKCWGDNSAGQLGDGTTASRTSPVDVLGLTSGVEAIAAGAKYTCAITTGGALKCWGSNLVGQLGIDEEVSCMYQGDKLPCSTVPVQVAGLESGVVAVAAGYGHTCAVVTAGGVKCWGWNYSGQLGDGSTTWRDAPVDVLGLGAGALAVAAGYGHTCAVLMEGGLKCWGSNIYGGLGAEAPQSCDDFFTNALIPCSTTPLDVQGLERVVAIAAGGAHTCAVTSAGEAACWGLNENGQLGVETHESCPDPLLGDLVPCSTVPVHVVGLQSGASSITASTFHHTCALTVEGHVKCWGSNLYGQLGDGGSCRPSCTTPVDVVGLASGVVAVGAGGFHTCAATAIQGVKCWGHNYAGQLGDGGRGKEHLMPVDVVELGRKSVPGDVNCDIYVDSIDAALVLQYHAGLIALLPCRGAADPNGDGRVNSIDAALILQFEARLICEPFADACVWD